MAISPHVSFELSVPRLNAGNVISGIPKIKTINKNNPPTNMRNDKNTVNFDGGVHATFFHHLFIFS